MSDPTNPVPRAILEFSAFRDDNGTGVAVDGVYAYVTAEQSTIGTEDGTLGDTRLYIGQYVGIPAADLPLRRRRDRFGRRRPALTDEAERADIAIRMVPIHLRGMPTPRALIALTVATVLTSSVGCGMFDDHGSRRRGGGGQSDRCDVDLDQWKSRVRHFKEKGRQNRDAFRQTKDDLTRDLERLDTAACRREVRKQIDDLLDEVRAENF